MANVTSMSMFITRNFNCLRQAYVRMYYMYVYSSFAKRLLATVFCRDSVHNERRACSL